MIGYEERNVNPRRKKTGDCVTRAISEATGIGYEETAKGLFDTWMKTGYEMTDKHTTEKYLESVGFVKHSQPRKPNGRKYLVGEIDELIGCGTDAVVSMANHYTAVRFGKVIDIWDCRCKTIGNYWTRK